MPRTAPIQNNIGANPYAKAREVQPQFAFCELCKRKIPNKNWNEHKGSKGHRKYEDEERRTNDQENTAPINNSSGFIDTLGSGGLSSDPWGDNADGQATGFHSANLGRGGNNACNGCGEQGHLRRDCPSSSGPSRRGCFNCGEEGHNKSDCPQPLKARDDGRACYNCGQPGHNKAECPEPPKPRDGGGNGGQQCFNCYEYGHRKSECNNPQVLKCRNCDEIGHHARECRKPKDLSRVKCNNCNQMGHYAKNCPNPAAAGEAGAWDNVGNSGGDASGGWDNGNASGATGESSGGWADEPATGTDGWGNADVGGW